MFVMNRINVNKRSHLNFILNFSYLFCHQIHQLKLSPVGTNSCLSFQLLVVQFCEQNLCWYIQWFTVLNFISIELFFPWNHRFHFHILFTRRQGDSLAGVCLPLCKQDFIWHTYFILWPIQSLFGNKDTPFEKIAENLSGSFKCYLKKYICKEIDII